MAQFARPNSDDNNSGSWSTTGSSLYSVVDETPANDSDYISVSDDYMSGGALSCTLGLGSVGDPGDHTSTSVVVRATTDAWMEGYHTLGVTLKSGSSTIKSENFDASSSWTNHTMSLSTSQAASIGDYTDLSVIISATDNAGGATMKVSQVYFTCPELGPVNVTPAHAPAAATAVFNQLTINPPAASAASSASSDSVRFPAPASAASSAHVGTVSIVIAANEVTPAHAASSASAVMNTVTKSSVVALAQAAAVMTAITILPLPASAATSGTLTPFPKVITPAFATAATSGQGTTYKLFVDLPGTLDFSPVGGSGYDINSTLRIRDQRPSGSVLTYQRINSTRQRTKLEGDGDTDDYLGLIMFDVSSIASLFKSHKPFASLDISLHHRTQTELISNSSNMSNHRLQGWAYKIDPDDYSGNVGVTHNNIPDADLAGTSLRTTASSYLNVTSLVPLEYTGGPAAYKLTIPDFETAFNEVIDQPEWSTSDKYINVAIEWTATHSGASSYQMNWWHNQISGSPNHATYPTTLEYRLWVAGTQVTPAPASVAATAHTDISVIPSPASAATSAASNNVKFPAPASAATSATLSALTVEITPEPAIAATSATSLIAKLPPPATAAAVADKINPIIISDPITSMTHYVNDRIGVFLYQKSDGEIMTNTGYSPADAIIPASGTITSLDHYLSTGYLGITLFQQGNGTIKHRTGYGSLTPTPIPSDTVGSMDALKSTDGNYYVLYQDDAGRIKYRV